MWRWEVCEQVLLGVARGGTERVFFHHPPPPRACLQAIARTSGNSKTGLMTYLCLFQDDRKLDYLRNLAFVLQFLWPTLKRMAIATLCLWSCCSLQKSGIAGHVLRSLINVTYAFFFRVSCTCFACWLMSKYFGYWETSERVRALYSYWGTDNF